MLAALFHYNNYNAQLADGYAQYEQQYNVAFDISQEDYLALSSEEKLNYDEAYAALIKDDAVLKTYNILLNLTLLITTFGILLSILLLEFFIPLWLKNGQTIGKKIFSIGLVRNDGVQMNNMQLFVRTVLGKFTIETMIPVYIIIMILFNSIGIVGLVVLGGILLVQLISLIATKTNSLIHDMLAGTVAVDISSQMIFRTTEDLIAYKKKIHAEQVARSNY
jgi:uncharacterized RDD family membrane protein YckC